MNVDLIASIITSAISLLLALFIYLKNRKSDTNKYFAGFLLLVGVYAVVNYLATHAQTSASALFWSKLVMISISFIGPFFYLFVATFPNRKSKINRRVVQILFTSVFVQVSLVILNLVLTGVSIINGNLILIQGPGMIVFLLLHLGIIIFASIALIQKYRKAKGIIAVQLQYITIGIVISLALTVFATAILGILFKIPILIPISPLYLLIAAFSITYSIIKHRFLDIRFIVARAVAYLLLIFIIAVTYVTALMLIGVVIIGAKQAPENILLSVVFTLFIAFTFQPLLRILEKITDRYFYQDKYDSNQILWQLNRSMASTLTLNKLTQQILKKLLSSVKISYGSIVLIRKQAVIWVESAGSVRVKLLKVKIYLLSSMSRINLNREMNKSSFLKNYLSVRKN